MEKRVEKRGSKETREEEEDEGWRERKEGEKRGRREYR